MAMVCFNLSRRDKLLANYTRLAHSIAHDPSRHDASCGYASATVRRRLRRGAAPRGCDAPVATCLCGAPVAAGRGRLTVCHNIPATRRRGNLLRRGRRSHDEGVAATETPALSHPLIRA